MQGWAETDETCLTDAEVEELRELAETQRRFLGYAGDTPVGPSISTILERLNIRLLGFPIKSCGDKPAFSAVLLYSDDDDDQLVFIGLNTADYFDKQIFAIAHELYHFYNKTDSHLSRAGQDGDRIERMADRFAAEFLLPEQALKRAVLREFDLLSFTDMPTRSLLRFIARLQCTWWLPYRSVVKRLKEINAISDQQLDELYLVDERDKDGEYARIGSAIDPVVFAMLNTATNAVRVSPKDIEVVLRNFQDNIIDEDTFIDILALFGKKPEDYGYESSISEDDLDELESP